jgi:PAS domain S-box-containing protein
MSAGPLPILLLGMFIVIAGFLFAGMFVRRYRQRLGVSREEREKTENVSFVINAFQDVTRQLKEQEKELRRLKALAEQRAETVESYTENILQCVTNGVVTFGPDDRVTVMNRAAAEMLGLDQAVATGMSCREIFGDAGVCRAIEETRDARRPSVRMEASLDRPSGRIWLGYNTAVLADNAGGVLGVILSFSDLTEVKRLQEQVELRERLTALGEMSAGIAHELRNPMGVIAGYLNLLSKKADAGGQSIIQSIQGEISGMNRIIGDLLTFARPAALNRVRIRVRELIEGCVTAVLQAKRGEAKVRAEVLLDDVEVVVDEGLMKQAVCNLIQNAVEAMPGGGKVTVTARNTGQECTITVGDTGVGIPKDRLKKVFLPFFTTKDDGVGMGLALVHKIVLSHGGRVEATSGEGKGTEFTVTLPRG